MIRALLRAIEQPVRYVLAKQQILSSTTKPLQNGLKHSSFSTLLPTNTTAASLLSNPKVQDISNTITRGVVKFSWGKGKRKTVRTVLLRFYRLNWGAWIHTKCGRNKKLWKKHAARKRRLRQHVFCNATQSTLLDKMVGSYWRRPKYFVEDPYEPYHTREEFSQTYRKPRPFVMKSETGEKNQI